MWSRFTVRLRIDESNKWVSFDSNPPGPQFLNFGVLEFLGGDYSTSRQTEVTTERLFLVPPSVRTSWQRRCYVVTIKNSKRQTQRDMRTLQTSLAHIENQRFLNSHGSFARSAPRAHDALGTVPGAGDMGHSAVLPVSEDFPTLRERARRRTTQNSTLRLFLIERQASKRKPVIPILLAYVQN